ncbi:PP2C family protein-serine/threonine phosphatase [Leucobacter soli]|uniref:PP2C family protein-serine/threonine phosphatase n=1 Tax=Leucobacter soli TaxID=2812850 RepID=UPI0036104267
MNARREQPLLEVSARTDAGLRRRQNEDWLLAADPCFLVADGMGGHEAGDEASRAAIAAFSEEFTAPGPATLERIDAALARARSDVARLAARRERGAGCTLTGVIRIEHDGAPFWYVLNIGDSRAYLHRDGELIQLTRDHSLLAERLDAGRADAASTPRNLITRALGSDDSRHDAWLLPIESATRLLICTDGLTSEVEDQRLETALRGADRPARLVERLLDEALRSGGRDNITLIVVDVLSSGSGTLGSAPRPRSPGPPQRGLIPAQSSSKQPASMTAATTARSTRSRSSGRGRRDVP